MGITKHNGNELALTEGAGLGFTEVPPNVSLYAGTIGHKPKNHVEYVTLTGVDVKVRLHTESEVFDGKVAPGTGTLYNTNHVLTKGTPRVTNCR